MLAPFKQSELLTKTKHINHGFFGRIGTSENGEFNCSYAISNDKEQVELNRQIATNMIGGNNIKIAALTQIHSNKIITIDKGSNLHLMPRADGLVTATKNIALTILTADCAPVMFADSKKPVIGIAHAGWQGALDGIIENTIIAMLKLGAKRENIIASIGPAISGNNYEIGARRAGEMISNNSTAKDFIFIPKGKSKQHFDLPNFIKSDLQKSNIKKIALLNVCTYQNPNKYFSHRYFTHFGGKQGRQISIICLQ